MISPRLSRLILSLGCLLTLSACTSDPSPVTNAATANGALKACAASPDWVTHPDPPEEIPGGGENFCQFYQFSWQWFLYLMSPSENDPSLRNFQVTDNYPMLQVKGDSCSSHSTTPRFFVRTMKDAADDEAFVLPERIGQAGDGATIYDQQGNVVFYSIVFGRDLCSAPDSGNLPDDTTEIKMAWRVIDEAQKPDYLWIEADVTVDDGEDDKELLGLVGYHLVRGTSEHPELIWATFEHKTNAPRCVLPQDAPQNGWSFLSPSCSDCLAAPDENCFNSCGFNDAQPATALTGNPSEICRVFPEGTAPGDHKSAENIADVTALNLQMVGPAGILTTLDSDDPMAVLANYFNVGALWVSDINEPATMDNQRGSLQLANATMETTFQGSLDLKGNRIEPSTSGVLNCFGCHQYTPNQTATSHLSHIFDEIVQQRGNAQ